AGRRATWACAACSRSRTPSRSWAAWSGAFFRTRRRKNTDAAMLTVFGSINLDIAVRVARLPLPGETLLGSQAQVSPGGKGANQAHAACLFGAATRLIGAVGRDAFADSALRHLREAGVDLSGVRQLDDADTGLATIAVAGGGENSIIVAPGANARVQAAWVSPQQLGETRMLLLQM